MQNVEFKAELRDLVAARAVCASIGAVRAEVLEQTDTYYRVPDARLKRRETAGREAEWVFYSRARRSAPKLSNFTLYSDEQARERFGASPLPVWVVVKKRRELWVYEGVRIHLDSVEGLGTYIEFEAMVCPGRTLARSHELVEYLRKQFGPVLGESIAPGYADLLADEPNPHREP